jgi:hypothetical protein
MWQEVTEQRGRIVEAGGRYAGVDTVAVEGRQLDSLFSAVLQHHFTICNGERPEQPRLASIPYADEGLQEYGKERIEASVAKWAERDQTERHYVLSSETSPETLLAHIAEVEKRTKALSQEAENRLLKTVNRYAVDAITIDELYSYALEPDGAARLSRRAQVRSSIAERLIDTTVLLAMYTSYLVKAELAMKAAKEGAYGEAARLLEQPRHYELEGENRRYAIACLIFEAQNKMWLRPLQARQMGRALADTTQSTVVEMIPGSGKTAFGAIIDVHHMWRPGQVAIAIFPQALITSTKHDIAKRYKELTGRSALFIDIDRTNESRASLRMLHNWCQKAQQSGDMLVTSKESIQALELLFIESLHAVSTLHIHDPLYVAAQRKLPYLKEILGWKQFENGSAGDCDDVAVLVVCHPLWWGGLTAAEVVCKFLLLTA